jgi:hypothetical protein
MPAAGSVVADRHTFRQRGWKMKNIVAERRPIRRTVTTACDDLVVGCPDRWLEDNSTIPPSILVAGSCSEWALSTVSPTLRKASGESACTPPDVTFPSSAATR